MEKKNPRKSLTVINRYKIKPLTQTKICRRHAAKNRSLLASNFKDLKSVGVP
jgi:hypothetical protein